MSCGGKPVDLTATEFRLLHFLATHQGRVFSRNELIDQVLGRDIEVLDRTVDVHVMSLRRKLGTCGDWWKPSAVLATAYALTKSADGCAPAIKPGLRFKMCFCQKWISPSIREFDNGVWSASTSESGIHEVELCRKSRVGNCAATHSSPAGDSPPEFPKTPSFFSTGNCLCFHSSAGFWRRRWMNKIPCSSG